MDNAEFQRILQGAVAGQHDSLEKLLQLYEPLIRKYSYIDGRIDEDLRQYILMRIALNINKFII